MLKNVRARPLTALAFALGLAAPVAMSSAAAKEKPKKEEAAKGSQITASKAFSPALKKAQDAVKAGDAAALTTAIAEGEAAASTPDDKYLVAFYQLQLGILNKDQALQATSLNALLDSGKTPPENLASFNFFSGRFAYVAKDYPLAIKRLDAARTAGATEADIPVLLMDSYFKTNQIDQGLAIANAAIDASHAAGQRASDELYVRPIQALQAAKRTDEMLDMLTRRVVDYNKPEIWRQVLYVFLQETRPEKEVGLDTMRLMRATGAMLQRPEYLEYVNLVIEAAQPGEAVKVIEEGRKAKIISDTDATFKEKQETQKSREGDDESTLTAYAQRPATLADPKIAGATGDTMVAYGRYADAVPLYQAALAKGGDKNLWTYRLGVAQALAGDSEAAKASFGQVTGAHMRLAKFWTAKLSSRPEAPATPEPAAAPAAS